jgi:WD40 repeat protein
MATSIIRLSTNDYYVVFGTSSGQIILNKLNFSKRRLEQIQNDNCYDAAVLCMRKLTIERGCVTTVAAGFTDGTVLLKKLYSENEKVAFTLVTRINAHAFGVNCLDLRRVDGGVLIATGGDDQQVKVFVVNGSSVVREAGSMSHSSVVKGVVCTHQDGKNIQIVSSSYDQRLKNWHWDGANLTKARERCHCLSDLNGMGRAGGRVVLVGLGILQLNL